MEENTVQSTPTVAKDTSEASKMDLTAPYDYQPVKLKPEDNFESLQETYREYSWMNTDGIIRTLTIERPIKQYVNPNGTLFIVDAWGQGYIIKSWMNLMVKINVPVGTFPFTYSTLKHA